MVELRRAYEAVPGGDGAKVASHWKVAQGRTVSADAPLNWGQFTCHLTVEKWSKSGKTQWISDFHLSFKFWQKISLAGSKQPGCKYLWNPAQSKFAFNGWFNAAELRLKPGENVTVAQKVTAFVRARKSLLLIEAAADPTMWATLQHAIPDAPAAA